MPDCLPVPAECLHAMDQNTHPFAAIGILK